jgi:hypothetical protein
VRPRVHDLEANGAVIEAEIAWFEAVLRRRLDAHVAERGEDVLATCPAPSLDANDAAYAQAVRAAELSPAERLVLILALLLHLRPKVLDMLLVQNEASKRRFTEFGGIDGAGGFHPTRETALFLLAGENMARRLEASRLFAPDRPLQARNILELPDQPSESGPWLPRTVSVRWISLITTGKAAPPHFGAAFPAQPLTTPYQWHDLVLGDALRGELEALRAWAETEDQIMHQWGLGKHLKPGYRLLFYGPPGTGKTMTAAVLGNTLGRPVYRVDLSRVVSKWIGETEKNLATLFDQAADGEMLLFFDEADALFGKRGDTQSANDRHANQQIAYLLQRIEDCPGIVILASNLRANIDAAFARRFQAILYFPMPDAAARAALWRAAFAQVPPSVIAPIDFSALAARHEIAGGAIINVLRHSAIHAARSGQPIDEPALDRAVRREFAKEDRHLA